MSVMTVGDAYERDQAMLQVRGFLGDLVQICVATRDIRRTMVGYLRLGIGPWRVHRLDPTTMRDCRFLGEPHEFSMTMAYAYSANVMWELVEPGEGDGSVQRFLAEHGEGVHHTGFLSRHGDFQATLAEFRARGFTVEQSGSWLGRSGFAFLATREATGVAVEIWDHRPGWTLPEPDEVVGAARPV